MPEKKTSKGQDYTLILEQIKSVNQSVDKLSVKLDGVTNIAMSMSNEIARLDERVAFVLESQKGQVSELADVKRRIATLESADAADNKMKDFWTKLFLMSTSALLGGLIIYLTNVQ